MRSTGRNILSAVLLVLAVSANAQSRKFDAFVPDGYFILREVEGDLNLDVYRDAIVIFAQKGEDSLSGAGNPMNRKCCLLIGKNDGTYRLSVENDQLVYYFNYDLNFKETLENVKIDQGMIFMDFYGGFRTRWYRSLTFRYNELKKEWYLLSDVNGTFDALEKDQSMVKETILTENDFGSIPISAFNIYK